jgi:hypothetical protein
LGDELDNDFHSMSKLADEQELIPTGLRPRKFAPRHFYHLAEPANWPLIHRLGLLSTERLLDLAKVSEKEREAILCQHRPESVTLANGVVIRDQKPMPPLLLARALPKDVSPSEWYRFLNRFVFLWANRERVERHLGACGSPQILLAFDAPRLLAQLGDRIYLSPINSGNARRRPAPRSTRTFVPFREWTKSGWPAMDGESRRRICPPVEILVEGNLTLQPFLLASGTVRPGTAASFEAELSWAQINQKEEGTTAAPKSSEVKWTQITRIKENEIPNTWMK